MRRTKRTKRKKSKNSGVNSIWLLTAVLAITFLVFANSLTNDFVNWDDNVNLTENPYLTAFTWENIKGIFTSTIIGNYNPLPIFTFAIEKALFGLNPAIFHLTNLILHLVVVFFVFRVLRLMELQPWAAALGALLFGIHPMRVESVVWITERKDVLFGTFYMAAIWTYIKGLKRGGNSRKWMWWTIGLFTLSLFSKIQAVALPLSLLAFDYYFKRPLKWRLISEKTPYFLLSLIVGILGIYFLRRQGSLDDETNYTLVERLLTGAYTYCIYLVKWLIPYRLSPLYPYPADLPLMAYFSPLGLLAVGGFAVWAYFKNFRNIVFAIAFFTFNVIFVLQILGAGQGYLADRFTYIAYFGLFFLSAWFFQYLYQKYPSRRVLLYGFIALYSLILIFMTVRQNRVWQNGETLWTKVLAHYPATSTAYQNRGKFYQSVRNLEKAKADFTRAIEVGAKPISFNSRGKIYFDEGKIQQALADFDAAIAAGTDIGEIYINRGAALASLGRYEEALQDFNKGIDLDPDRRQGYSMRSLLHFSTNNFAAALSDYDKILKMEPQNADVWYESGLALGYLNQPRLALERFNNAIAIKPDAGLFYKERAKVHRTLGNTKQAIADENTARQLGVKLR